MSLPDALREALGQVIADQRREWRREREVIEAQNRQLAAESRQVIAELRAQIAELQAQVSEKIGAAISKAVGDLPKTIEVADVERMIAPGLEKVGALEARVADLSAVIPVSADIEAAAKAVVREIASGVPKPADMAEIERAVDERCARLEKRLDDMPEVAAKSDLASLCNVCEETREMVAGLPGPDGLVALVEKTVAAAVALDPNSIKRMIEVSVAAGLPRAREVDHAQLAEAVAAEVERVAAAVPAQIERAVKAAVEALPPAPTAEEVAALMPPPEPGRSVTIDDVAPLVERLVTGAFATVRVPEDGKSVEPSAVKAMVDEAVAALPGPEKTDREELAGMVAAEVARVAEALPKVPTAAEVAALIPPPEPGKSVAMDDVRSYLDEAISGAFATMRAPEDGDDADPKVIEAMVDEAVARLPPAAPGENATPEQIAAAVEKVLATWERPKDGDPGQSVTLGDVAPLIDEGIRRAVAALPPPRDGAPGKLPLVEAWRDRVHQEGEAVVFDGATYQALRLTGKAPPHEDWRCIARSGRDGNDGRSLNPRSTWAATETYGRLDVVTLDGGAFMARRDNPGPCPGDGWQLLVMRGKSGLKGEKGEPGRSIKGDPGPAVVGIAIDDQGIVTLTNADGTTASGDFYDVLSRLVR